MRASRIQATWHKGRRNSLFAVAVTLFSATLAWSQILPNGDEFRVNSITVDYQQDSDASSGADGSFIVVWASEGSNGSDSSGFSVQARRFDRNGVPLSEDFQVNEYTTASQRRPAIATDQQGNFVVVWQSLGSFGTDSSLDSIQARLFDATGNPLGSEFQVNTYTTNYQLQPAVAIDPAGGFLVVWESFGSYGTDTSFGSIQGRRYDASGAPLGNQFQINTHTPGQQARAGVAIDSQGGFGVTWSSASSAGTDTELSSVQARRFDADGTPLGEDLQVNTYTTSFQYNSSIARQVQDEFLIVWESFGSYGSDTYGASVQGQRLSSAFEPLGSQFQVNTKTTGNQELPSVVRDTRGNFVVAWEDYSEIKVRRVFSSSPPVDPSQDELAASSSTSDRLLRSDVTADPQGNLLVSWTACFSGYQGHECDVRARRFDALFRDGFEGGDASRWTVVLP